MPPGNGGDEVGISQASPVQHRLHQPLIAESQRLVPVGLLCPKIHKAIPQPTVQLGQERFPARAGRSILFTNTKVGMRYRRSSRQSVSVWLCTPSVPLMTSTA